MPIYEYRCSACGHEKEVLQKMSDAPLTDCPACGKPTLKKLVSAAGFQLKGSGWYATDFRGGNKPRGEDAAKGDDSAKGEASAKGDAKAGDKAADKAGDKGATASDGETKPKDAKSEAASTGTAPAPAAT